MEIFTVKNFKIFFLNIFFIIPLVTFGVQQYTENDSIKFEELTSEGRELGRIGQHYESLQVLLEALEIGENIFSKKNNNLRRTYYYLSLAYKNLSISDKAIEFSKLTEKAFLEFYGENHRNIAAIYLNLGNVYRDKLNFKEALQYFEQNVNVALNQPEVNKADVAGAYYSMAEVYYLMSRNKDALQIIDKYLPDAYESDKVLYYNLLGAIYQILGDNEKVNDSYIKSISIITEIAEDEIEIAKELLSYSAFLVRSGDLEKAQTNLNKALKIIQLTEKTQGANLSYYYRINGFLEENKYVKTKDFGTKERNARIQYLEKANYWYQKSLNALNFPGNYLTIQDLDSINSTSNINCIELLTDKARTFLEIAEIYQSEKNDIYESSINEALDHYRFIGNYINRLRKEIAGDENKIALSELEQSVFIEIVKTAYLAYENTKDEKFIDLAFKNAERAKAGSIFEKLSDQLAQKNSLIPGNVLQEQQLLNSRITGLNKNKLRELSSTNPDKNSLDEIETQLFILKRERTALNDSLENQYPDYFKLKYSDNSVSPAQVSENLGQNDALIEYVLNETDSTTELYTFFITPQETDFIKVELNLAFIKDVEDVFYFMANPRYQFTKNQDAKLFCVSANNLFNKLIRPVKNKIQNKNLIIIPDGKLNYLSFDALLEELPDTSSTILFNKLKYLIKNHNINYSYSSNLLFGLPSNTKKINKNVLAFAPEYKNDSILINNKLVPLLPLLGTQKEVQLIAENLDTELFQGENATFSNFSKNYNNFDIIHLAMHAFINDSLPALSKFAFAHNSANNDESVLTTGDIYNLNLNARLTVLSACNTGSGQLKKGEGVMSLARGFLYAGCPSIVMTLWEVEDNSGTIIVSSFYKYLKKGKTKSEALRAAKLDYLEGANPRSAHPHYWLGYVNIGDNSSLFRSYDYYFFGLLILVIVGISTEQIIRKRKSNKI